MQWIKHKKEERMTVAAKVVGGVRLGLVDIKEVIRELNTEEMQRVPEIHLLLHESLLHTLAICEFEVCSREIQTAFHESGM